MPGIDLWDEARDARKYAGPWPVIAHPPCNRWSPMARINEKRYGHRVGDDAGCFESALTSVRRYGGVLEHPAVSIAWDRFSLPRPIRDGWQYDFVDDSWVCVVSQRAYGHPAQKLTWLYYVGIHPPPQCNWSRPDPVASCSFLSNNGGRKVRRLKQREAAHTTPEFRDLLIQIAIGASVARTREITT